MASTPWDDLEQVFAAKPRPCAICEKALPAIPVQARPVVERLLADKTIAPSTLAKQIRARGVPTSREAIEAHRSHLEAA
jgi:hypothetical protein